MQFNLCSKSYKNLILLLSADHSIKYFLYILHPRVHHSNPLTALENLDDKCTPAVNNCHVYVCVCVWKHAHILTYIWEIIFSQRPLVSWTSLLKQCNSFDGWVSQLCIAHARAVGWVELYKLQYLGQLTRQFCVKPRYWESVEWCFI